MKLRIYYVEQIGIHKDKQEFILLHVLLFLSEIAVAMLLNHNLQLRLLRMYNYIYGLRPRQSHFNRISLIPDYSCFTN